MFICECEDADWRAGKKFLRETDPNGERETRIVLPEHVGTDKVLLSEKDYAVVEVE